MRWRWAQAVFGCAFLLAAVTSLVMNVGVFSTTVIDSACLIREGHPPPWHEAQNDLSLRTQDRVRAWSGRNELPLRVGGDYLAVIASQRDIRTACNVIATLLERERKRGSEITCLIIPDDLKAYGTDVKGGSFQRADGSTIEFARRTYYVSVLRKLTVVPLSEQVYDPRIDDREVAEMQHEVGFYGGMLGVWMSDTPATDGVYVLHIDGAEESTYIVPLEVSPVRDEL